MEINQSYQVPFAVDKVFSAWVSSDTVIAPATAMDIDPKVGGHYRLIMQGDDFSMTNEGKFLALRENEYVHYTWEWNGDGEVSHIEVTFTPQDTGTRVDIYHHGFSKTESVTSHASGWDSYMEGFTRYLQERVS